MATALLKRPHKKTFEKTERIQDEMDLAILNQSIMFGHCGLHTVPEKLFDPNYTNVLEKLRRLDLSHNYLTILHERFSLFNNLRELWLGFNPITIFPKEILLLTKLEVLDIHNTYINELPTEIVNLKNLSCLDWRETPLANQLQTNHNIMINDLFALQITYQAIYTRKITKEILYSFLLNEHYVLDADKSYTKSTVLALVEEIALQFTNLHDFESFTRRPITFIPKRIDDIKNILNTAAIAKKLFYEMKRDTDRKRLAADVEIKIRAIYFDRIERNEVMKLLDSIYAFVLSLEDIEFLIQYATQLFPSSFSAKHVHGELIWHNLLELQDELIQKREESVVGLTNGLMQLYPEQTPDSLLMTAREVASYFQLERFATKKELLRMTQLTADCSKVFPPDYLAIVPEEIIEIAQERIFKNLK